MNPTLPTHCDECDATLGPIERRMAKPSITFPLALCSRCKASERREAFLQLLRDVNPTFAALHPA